MKRITFRFKSDEVHEKFMTKIKYREKMSFQEFVEECVDKYLNEEINF